MIGFPQWNWTLWEILNIIKADIFKEYRGE